MQRKKYVYYITLSIILFIMIKYYFDTRIYMYDGIGGGDVDITSLITSGQYTILGNGAALRSTTPIRIDSFLPKEEVIQKFLDYLNTEGGSTDGLNLMNIQNIKFEYSYSLISINKYDIRHIFSIKGVYDTPKSYEDTYYVSISTYFEPTSLLFARGGWYSAPPN